MYSIKFYRTTEDGTSLNTECHSFSCPHYSAYTRENGTTSIIIYKDLFDTEGVERHISKEDEHYDTCYIENIAGKTIDSYKGE